MDFYQVYRRYLDVCNPFLNKGLETRKETLAVSLDNSKAFGHVWHKNILAKLSAFGFTSKFCNWFESFLSNRSIKVVVVEISFIFFSKNGGVL